MVDQNKLIVSTNTERTDDLTERKNASSLCDETEINAEGSYTGIRKQKVNDELSTNIERTLKS